VITLGLSGLPYAQQVYLRQNPGVDRISERVCQGLDSAAGLVIDGEVVAAAAEERFTGEKGTGAFPANAIDYCLREAGVGPNEVTMVAHGFAYDECRRLLRTDPRYFDEVLSGQTVVAELAKHGWTDVADRFHPVRHHVAHAASAFHPSGFDEALVVVSDGMGELDALSVFTGRAGTLNRVHHQDVSQSLGILYSLCTRFLGFAFNSDEYKVMGLAAYGDPGRYAPVFDRLVGLRAGAVEIDWPWTGLGAGTAGYPGAMGYLAGVAGFPARRGDAVVGPEHADFAAALQKRLAEVLTGLVSHWVGATGRQQVCLAGGTFLNCRANQDIAALPSVADLFVQPAAGDDGTAIGAALHVDAENASPRRSRERRRFNPFLGPAYPTEHVARVVEAAVDIGAVTAERIDDVEDYLRLAAADIAADRIVGWFHGRMEFGPRALGNRSILALPAGAAVKDRINALVKLREPFRPFAPALLEDEYDRLFEGRPLDPTAYMLCTATARDAARELVPGAVHDDGTSRVQVVPASLNPLFHRLLRKVQAATGVGCVINTSLNIKGQPLIMAPETAIKLFTGTGLDRLYLAGYRLSKPVGQA